MRKQLQQQRIDRRDVIIERHLKLLISKEVNDIGITADSRRLHLSQLTTKRVVKTDSTMHVGASIIS